MATDYFALGTQYYATMKQPARATAFYAATNKGTSEGTLVSITVKDAGGADVVLSMDQNQFVAFVAGFAPL